MGNPNYRSGLVLDIWDSLALSHCHITHIGSPRDSLILKISNKSSTAKEVHVEMYNDVLSGRE